MRGEVVLSHSTTRRPRPARSRAMPAPLDAAADDHTSQSRDSAVGAVSAKGSAPVRCVRFGVFLLADKRASIKMGRFDSRFPASSYARRHDAQSPPVGPAGRSGAPGRFGVGRTLAERRRDAADRAARRQAALRRRPAGALPRRRARAGSTTENIAYRQRQKLNESAKQRIARAVAPRGAENCSLLINIGTTTEAIARELLRRKGLRVITNNLNVAAILSGQPRLRGDRRRRRGARPRPRHRRRGDGGLHPPVPRSTSALIGISGSSPTARCAIRLPRGEGPRGHHRATRARSGWRPTTASSTGRRWSELARLDQIDRSSTDAAAAAALPVAAAV